MLGLPRFCPYPSWLHCFLLVVVPLRSGRTVAPCIPFFLCVIVSLACRTCSCNEWLFIVCFYFLWVVPGDEFEYEDPVEYVHDEQAFDTSENIAGKWSLPPISLLSSLASCLLYCYVALPTTCLSSIPYCHVKPLTHLPSKRCLAMLLLLLNPSYSVASCRWSWRFLHGGQDFCWDITISLILLLMHLYTW